MLISNHVCIVCSTVLNNLLKPQTAHHLQNYPLLRMRVMRSGDPEGYMKKILLAVLLIGTMTAFGAAPQAQEQKPPMQMMHMTEMMKACPMTAANARTGGSCSRDD